MAPNFNAKTQRRDGSIIMMSQFERGRLEGIILRACLMEAGAAKVGNVHPGASFDNFDSLCHADFVTSAEVVSPILAGVTAGCVGETIFEAVVATRERVGKNTNLGIILLLAPLAAVPFDVPLRDGISLVLNGLTVRDTEFVYRAIEIAKPGGLGRVEKQDVSGQPTVTLKKAMSLAADRDLIAKQYRDCFVDLLPRSEAELKRLQNELKEEKGDAIVGWQIEMIAKWGDSLIERKCGVAVSGEASRWAKEVLELGGLKTKTGREHLQQFDDWLRADGNRRNPGTTADLIAAKLFVLLREDAVRAY